MTESVNNKSGRLLRWSGISRILRVFTVLLGLCWLLLWAVLPGQLQQAAANWAQQHGRSLQLDDIRINPFNLRLTLGRISLDEGNGSPLFHADGAVLDAELWPLLIGRWQLAELTIRQPQLTVIRDGQGIWNWSRFVADISNKSPAETKPEPLPKLLLERITLARGQVRLADALAGDTRLQALPLSLKLQQVSTLPQLGGYALTATLEDGAQLDWRGTLGLQPVQSRGTLKLRNLTLASIWGYVQPHFRVAAPGGKLSLTLPYHVDLTGAQAKLTSHGFAANLDDLAFAAPGSDSPFTLRQLAISGGALDLAQQTLRIGKVLLNGATLATVLDAHGQPDWLAALPPAGEPVAKPVSQSPGWRVSLPVVRLQNWQLHAQHRGFVTPLDASLTLDTLDTAIQLEPQGGLRIGNSTLALSDIRAGSHGKPPFATLAEAQLATSTLDVGARRITPGDIRLSGLQLKLARDKSGQLDIQRALRQHPSASQAKLAVAAASPAWQIRYPAVTLADSRLQWRDETTRQPVALMLENLAASISGDANEGFALTLNGQSGQGKLAARAQLAANFGDIHGQLQLDNLPLAALSPYALENTVLRFGRGELSADMAFGLKNSQWQTDGSASLNRLALYEPGQKEMLVGWHALQVKGIQASAQRVRINDVRLLSPQLRFILDEKRVSNFSRLQRPASGVAANPAPVAKSGKSTTRPVIDIRAIRVRDARMDFADLGLKPSFGTRIHSLSGSILGLSSAVGRRGTVALDGRVDQFGDVRIHGALSPLNITHDLDMALNFRNVRLGSLNPYSMNFAGWQITDGRLSTELRYVLKARELKGDNRMVIDHIQLGEEVADYDGTRLPLALAVAILEDSDGRIDLSMPVAGSLDAPEFSYGHLVWQAFKNILVKVATAPFRVLFGGEGFDAIYTDAGDVRIPPPEREKLQQLAEAMGKRPKLMLALGGGFDAALDSRELARRRVDQDILKRAAYAHQSDEPLPLPDMGDPAIRKAVGDVYAAQFGRFSWLKRIATEADTPVRAQAMRGELLAAQKVDEAALNALAKVRGEAARKLLLDVRPELAGRISLLEPGPVNAEKDGVPLLIKLK